MFPRAPLLALLLGSACGEPQAVAPLVLVFSWDTTRADALGAYAAESHWGLDLPPDQRPRPQTPAADQLAAEGVRFSWALAHAPTTLNSHASIFSGRDPHGHGVPRNGFRLPDNVPTLPERASAAGWATIGVAGASVLAEETGISRGFDIWDATFEKKVRHRYERTCGEVIARLLHHLETVPPERPVFAFAHCFDAHSPWESAPEELRRSFGLPGYQGAVNGSSAAMDFLVKTARAGALGTADRRQARALYLAEVAAQDAALARLLTQLGARDRDLRLVLLGDHGEALEEIPTRAYGHGLDVGLVSIHVPLIFWGKGAAQLAPRVVDHPVGLWSVAPTLATWMGLGPIGQGPDLSAYLLGDPASPAAVPHFAEATKPGTDGPGPWNNLGLARGVVANGRLRLRDPRLGEQGLYALAPGQPPLSDEGVATQLDSLLGAWDAAAPPAALPQLSSEAEGALRALGYLDGPLAPAQPPP